MIEIFKTIHPSVANIYAACAILMVILVGLGVATLFYLNPSAVFRCFPHAVCSATLGNQFALKTAAALNPTIAQTSGSSLMSITTITSTEPTIATAANTKFLDHDKTPKALPQKFCGSDSTHVFTHVAAAASGIAYLEPVKGNYCEFPTVAQALPTRFADVFSGNQTTKTLVGYVDNRNSLLLPFEAPAACDSFSLEVASSDKPRVSTFTLAQPFAFANIADGGKPSKNSSCNIFKSGMVWMRSKLNIIHMAIPLCKRKPICLISQSQESPNSHGDIGKWVNNNSTRMCDSVQHSERVWPKYYTIFQPFTPLVAGV